MNYSIIRRTTGLVLKFEAIFLLLPALTGFLYGEREGVIYFALAAAYFAIGFLINLKGDTGTEFYTKEGFISVALVWIVISLCGALPFVLCGDIPNYSNALFETISGFTTTGSSILTDVEALSHASLFWRSFTHWVGGMGVIVFVLAIMPMRKRRMGSQMHMMRAESPGPVVGKLVPKIRDTAMILYMIYFGMTVTEIVLLLIAGMPLFDSLCLSFGTAGTGGFGVLGDSIASYPILQQAIITIFMILFGINFNAYFILFLGKDKKEAFRMTYDQKSGIRSLIVFLPYAEEEDIHAVKEGDDLILHVRNEVRRLRLPDLLCRRELSGWTLENGELELRFGYAYQNR